MGGSSTELDFFKGKPSITSPTKCVCCSKDESDWAESQVLKVSDCNRLVVSLGGNNNEAIHRTLSQSKAAIIFEDIKELELSSFEISHTPTESNKRGQITSIIFRWKVL